MLRLKTKYLQWRLRYWQDQLTIRYRNLVGTADYLTHVRQMAPAEDVHWQVRIAHAIRNSQAEEAHHRSWRHIHVVEGKINRIEADLARSVTAPVNIAA